MKKVWYNLSGNRKTCLSATVAQLAEQLTRNEQVVRSNRISSSSLKAENIAENRYVLGFFFFRDIKSTCKNRIQWKMCRSFCKSAASAQGTAQPAGSCSSLKKREPHAGFPLFGSAFSIQVRRRLHMGGKRPQAPIPKRLLGACGCSAFIPPSRSWPGCAAYPRRSRAAPPCSRRTTAAAQ